MKIAMFERENLKKMDKFQTYMFLKAKSLFEVQASSALGNFIKLFQNDYKINMKKLF